METLHAPFFFLPFLPDPCPIISSLIRYHSAVVALLWDFFVKAILCVVASCDKFIPIWSIFVTTVTAPRH